MFLPPWQIMAPTFTVLYIADRALRLPRLKMGEVESFNVNHQVSRDLLSHQSQRPITRRFQCEFGGVLRRSTNPNTRVAQEFQAVIRTHPGHIAKLVLANKTTYYGTITAPTLHEVRSISDCQYNLAFTLAAYRIVRPTGTPIYK